MNEIAPCKGCPNRHTACHDSCQAYKDWKERHLTQQKQLDAYKNRSHILWSPARENAYRRNTSFNSYVRKQGGMR